MKIYNPKRYWNERGQYESDKYPQWKKDSIRKFLQSIPSFESVLEIGPGEGNLTEILQEDFKIKKYAAVEISEDRCLMFKNRFNLNILNMPFQELKTPDTFDLVISAHCLLHIKPEEIKDFMGKMLSLGKQIVHFDPYPDSHKGEWEYYNFPHDYFTLWHEFKIGSYSEEQLSERIGIWHIIK